MLNKLAESMEAIAYQSTSDFPKKITTYFQNAIDGYSDSPATNKPFQVKEAFDNIYNLTKLVTGIDFAPEWTKSGLFDGPYKIIAEVPNLNALSPINPDAQKRMAKYDLDGIAPSEIINGWVDLKLARVGGFFTHLRNKMMISPSFLNGHFTASELAALYLHELGHCFTMYEYLGETLITNFILAEVVGRMDSQATIEKRAIVGRAALRLARVDKTVDESANSADITALVLEGQIGRMQRALNTRWYDQRLAEVVADQFAARWGMGVDLAKALVKQERSKGIFAEAGFEPVWFGALMNFVNISSMPFKKLAEGTVKATMGAIVKLATSYSTTMIGSSLSFFFISNGYATIPQRIAALRREMVSVLKNREIDPTLRKQILAEIDLLDEVAKEKHQWSDVYSKVGKYSLDVVLGRGRELGQQEMTEELANNRLYQLSAALKG